jgi:hypothetical protein
METSSVILQNSNALLLAQPVIGVIQLPTFVSQAAPLDTTEINTTQIDLVFQYALLLTLDNIEQLVEYVCQHAIPVIGQMDQQDYAQTLKLNAQIILLRMHLKNYV